MPAGQTGLVIVLWDKVRGLEVLRMASSSFPPWERFAENPEQGFPSAPGNCQTEALGWGGEGVIKCEVVLEKTNIKASLINSPLLVLMQLDLNDREAFEKVKAHSDENSCNSLIHMGCWGHFQTIFS